MEVEEKSEDETKGDSKVCDAFVDRFSGMINHEKIGAFLSDQEHM